MKGRSLIREIDLDTGATIMEAYRLKGKLHRDPSEGPAYVLYWDEHGHIATEKYYWLGRLHRENGPARVD